MSEIKVNKISPKQTCTQLTLGDSGDTIIIPAGATIQNSGTATGFGRTGTVNWDTTKKTTGFTAVNGSGYFCDTTSAAFTATLPATPSAGDIVAFSDYTGTWGTNNLTVGRNGSNINAAATDLSLNINNTTATLIYVDATEGWRVIDTGSLSSIYLAPAFVAATGGTVLTCGDYKTHVFTGPGTFTVSCAGNSGGSNSVEYLVVAGGGAGGGGGGRGGGGGAGGYRQNYPSPTTAGLPVTATAYPITVGSGGSGVAGASATRGNSGNNSIFSSITSAGGGGGGGGPTGSPNLTGVAGGSGGGAGNTGNSSGNPGGAGNTPPVSPPQGNPGGANSCTPELQAGGGGAGAAGSPSSGQPKATGGGVGSPIATAFFGPTAPSYGTPGPAPGRYFAGGGGAANDNDYNPGPAPAGGSGGGGNGEAYPGISNAVSGTVNTGGGGGGNIGNTSGSGGSGIVVIRYKFQ